MKDMPKVELHLHHEGAAPPAFIQRLAGERKVDISRVFDSDGRYVFKGFQNFLKVYEAATSVLQSPTDYARLTKAVLQDRAAEGVIYCETFVSPDFCGGGDVGAWREYLAAIVEAAQEAEAAYGITWRGIGTAVRHFGPEQAKRTSLCAAETAGEWITGFGMGGDETRGQQGDFAYAFDQAREAGLRLTTHAGEFGGPESIWEAIRDLNVDRIGHGVRSIEDPALVRELAARQITLEVCPGSNVALGLYKGFAAHPIARLREAGVKITVSTDDPPFFHTTLCREYDMLAQSFGWDETDFCALNQTAAEAAFCDAKTRARIEKKLEKN